MRKAPTKKAVEAAVALPQGYVSADERRAAGKALRDAVPRTAQGGWKRPRQRRDPIELLRESNEGRDAGADPNSVRPHGAVAVRFLSRRRGGDGGRSGDNPGDGPHRAGMRRRAPHELRRLRHARAQYFLRHQRFRRNSSRAVGMGREAPGGEHRHRRRGISASPTATRRRRRPTPSVPIANG